MINIEQLIRIIEKNGGGIFSLLQEPHTLEWTAMVEFSVGSDTVTIAGEGTTADDAVVDLVLNINGVQPPSQQA